MVSRTSKKVKITLKKDSFLLVNVSITTSTQYIELTIFIVSLYYYINTIYGTQSIVSFYYYINTIYGTHYIHSKFIGDLLLTSKST